MRHWVHARQIFSLFLRFQMNNSLGQFLYHSSRFFSVSIRRETRASRWRVSDLKPATSFAGLKFVRDFSWKISDFGFERSLLGGFASMAFSGGNGGSGKSDSNSGKGDDGEDEKGSNLVGPWSLPEDEWKYATLLELGKLLRSIISILYASPLTTEVVDQFVQILALPFILISLPQFVDAILWFVLPCILFIGILAAALCTLVLGYCVKQVIRFSAENDSNPPDNAECCICFSTYEGRPTWSSLPCDHWFHSSCINSWVRINPICPICRQYAYRTT